MQKPRMVAFGGISLIVGALAFVAVFSYLAAKFNYPDVLDGTAAEVLPRLTGGGAFMRAVWAVYAFLPLLLLPGAVGAWQACPASRPRMTLAMIAMTLGVLAMCLGLMRWPTIHWSLAQAFAAGGAETKESLGAVFSGLNLYLGNYIGEFLGESMLSLFFFLTGLSCVEEAAFPRWVGWTGAGFGGLFFLGAFRNVTRAVQPVADLNNGLLPLWLIVLGVALIRHAKRNPGIRA